MQIAEWGTDAPEPQCGWPGRLGPSGMASEPARSADLSDALAGPVRVVGRQPRDAVVEGEITPITGQRLRGRQHRRLTLGPAPDQGPGPIRRRPMGGEAVVHGRRTLGR